MTAHSTGRPAIFLDRDGVIIHNRARYVRSWDDVRFYRGALTALARLRASPYLVFIITNQAGIGKGYIASADVQEMNRRIVTRIQETGGKIDGVYFCPHRADEGCTCRKPQPGMLLRAAQEFAVDLQRSYMVGDALTDIEAGKRAGVGGLILVRTGRGNAQLRGLNGNTLPPFQIVSSITQAVNAILRSENQTGR